METNNKKNEKQKFSPRSMSIIICALFTALVVGANMLVSELPVEKTKLDTTEMGLHTLSDNTKEILSALTDDIDIYRICTPGKEDNTLTDMLERYASLSPNVNVSTIDPAVYPNFEAQYGSDKLSDNSIIVSSAKRNQIIDYSNIATYTAFNGEDYLTNAIKYVTSDNLPVLYALEGHGEKTPDDSLTASLNKAGIELKELNLLSSGEIPQDAQCVFIYAPSSDLNQTEAAELSKYLENSGKLLLITDYNSSKLSNISAIMSSYGVSTVDGVVMEGASDKCLSGYPYYIIPTLDGKSSITKPINESGLSALMPLAQAVVKNSSLRDSVKVTDLFTTTDKAYIITDETYEKDESAPKGPYSLAVSVEEKYENIDTKIVWVTTSEFISSDTSKMIGNTNEQIFSNMVNYLCGSDVSVSVSGKNTSLGTLTVSTSQSRIWKIILIGIVPSVVAVLGLAVWYRRRNR